MTISVLSLQLFKPRWALLSLTTDTGETGYGEPALPGDAEEVVAAFREAEPLIAGQPANDHEALMRTLLDWAEGAEAPGSPARFAVASAVDQALWDLHGQSRGTPVHALLGTACRTRVRVMAPCTGRTPRDLASVAKAQRVKGLLAVKTPLGVSPRRMSRGRFKDAVLQRVKAVRDEVGGEVDIVVDFQGRLSADLSAELAQSLSGEDLLFIQEPVCGGGPEAMQRVRSKFRGGVSAGRFLSRYSEFEALVGSGAVDCIQPDPCLVGGLAAFRRIAHCAHAHGVRVMPGLAEGPVALSVNLQLAMITPNMPLVEIPGFQNSLEMGRGVLTDSFVPDRGIVSSPAAPGLGIDLNEGMLSRRRADSPVELEPAQHVPLTIPQDWIE